MNKKQVKEWVRNAIDKGYDRDDISSLLLHQVKSGKMTKKDVDSVIEVYEDMIEDVESLKIGFLTKIKLKRRLKKVKKLVETFSDEIKSLTSQTKKLNKKQKKELEDLRERMIVAIVGDPDKEISGLNEIFDVSDDKGKTINRETLQTYSLEDIEDLLILLVETLEKEI